MLIESLKRMVPAAVLSFTTLFAYQSLADSRDSVTVRKIRPAAHLSVGPILHGKSVARFGGYELNISFTSDGKLFCFDLKSSARERG